jgi:hypothetical protein
MFKQYRILFENMLMICGPFVYSVFSFAELLAVGVCPAMRLPRRMLWK